MRTAAVLAVSACLLAVTSGLTYAHALGGTLPPRNPPRTGGAPAAVSDHLTCDARTAGSGEAPPKGALGLGRASGEIRGMLPKPATRRLVSTDPATRRASSCMRSTGQFSNDDHYLDPQEPEVLIYANAPRRPLVLIGVMFAVPRGVRGPTPGGPITRWHTHLVCATRQACAGSRRGATGLALRAQRAAKGPRCSISGSRATCAARLRSTGRYQSCAPQVSCSTSTATTTAIRCHSFARSVASARH